MSRAKTLHEHPKRFAKQYVYQDNDFDHSRLFSLEFQGIPVFQTLQRHWKDTSKSYRWSSKEWPQVGSKCQWLPEPTRLLQVTQRFQHNAARQTLFEKDKFLNMQATAGVQTTAYFSGAGDNPTKVFRTSGFNAALGEEFLLEDKSLAQEYVYSTWNLAKSPLLSKNSPQNCWKTILSKPFNFRFAKLRH